MMITKKFVVTGTSHEKTHVELKEHMSYDILFQCVSYLQHFGANTLDFRRYLHLVGGCIPSEKRESVGMTIPNSYSNELGYHIPSGNVNMVI